MLSLYRTLSLRYFRLRWSRAALVVASIALGVATIVATQTLNQAMVGASHAAATPLGLASGLLVSNGEVGVARQLVEDLRRARIPGVQSVAPLVVDRAAVPALNNRAVALVGVELSADGDGVFDNPWGVRVMPSRPLWPLPTGYPVFVGSMLAGDLPDGPAEFDLRVAGKARHVSGFGTVDADGAAAALGGNLVVMRLEDAARVTGRPDTVTRIDLALDPEADREQVHQQVQAVLAGRAVVATPQANAQSIHDVVAGLELALALGGACALVVGLFLVYNALSVTVAERRHDIGLLRSLGATRGQVAGLFTGEAGLLGLAGAALGVPLGWLLARLGLHSFHGILSDVGLAMAGGRVELRTGTVVLAVSAGVATTLLASLVPAVQAAQEQPADAVRRAPPALGSVYAVLQVGASCLLAAVGSLCIAGRGQLPLWAGTLGGLVLLLLAGLLATPWLAAFAARLFQPVARQLLGIEGRLAADNLARSPGRSGLVIAALAAGVALMLQTAGVIRSGEEAILTWIDRSLAADLFVTANSPLTESGQTLVMPGELGRRLGSLPEVERVVPVRMQRVDFRDKKVLLLALDGVGFYSAGRLPSPVPGLELFPQLREPATAVVSDNFALLHRVAVGDRITVRGPDGPVPLWVIGTVLDYSWNRGTVFVDRAHYRQQFRDDRVDVYHLYLKPGSGAEAVRQEVQRRWGAEESLVTLTRPELREEIGALIRRVYGIGYAQQVVVGLVAALGVVMALLISVLQRRRELGLLRAVGASRGQVLLSVLTEAGLMGAIGAALGLLLGIPLEWYAVTIILPDEAGFLFPLCIPWRAVGLVVGMALLTALLAGLGPAVHAVRMRIADAIAYE